MLVLENSSIYPFFALCISCVCLAFLVLLTVWFFYNDYNFKGASSKYRYNPCAPLSKALTYLMLIVNMISAAVNVINGAGAAKSMFTCIGYYVLYRLFFLLGKIILFLLFIFRLKSVFVDSMVSPHFIWVYRLLLVVIFLFVATTCYETATQVLPSSFWAAEREYCYYNRKAIGDKIEITLMMILEIVSHLLFSYLFIRPLQNLHLHAKEHTISSSGQQLLELIARCAVLVIFTSVVLITTVIVIVITDAGALVMIDYWCNSLSVVLLPKTSSKAYLTLCRCCHRKVTSIVDEIQAIELASPKEMSQDI